MDENVIETTEKDFNEEEVKQEEKDNVFRLHEMRDAIEASMENIKDVNTNQKLVISVLKDVEKEELKELINNLEEQSKYLTTQYNELEERKKAMDEVLEITKDDSKIYDTINKLLLGLGIFKNK